MAEEVEDGGDEYDDERTPSLRIGGEEEAAGDDGDEVNAKEEEGGEEVLGNRAGDVQNVGEEEEEQEAIKKASKVGGNKRKAGDPGTKKAKKRNTNVWSKSTSRKSSKKGGNKAQATKASLDADNSVYLNPVVPRVDDAPDLPVLLSKLQKAEKVELSSDRLTAGSCKGYRMVRATRGVVEGAWYFEIKVEHLGSTGHTRLGWCTQKGDVQAPVGYDTHGYAYRDLEGSKVHAAWREPYGEAYVEGDTIGCYINLPNGAALAPKAPEIVGFRGNPYTTETREEFAKPLPGSQIAFFRNGVFQGSAYKDIYAGRYYPAASMYTLPNEPNCTVRFNFGPEFWCPPSSWGELAEPQPMSSAPFFAGDGQQQLILQQQQTTVAATAPVGGATTELESKAAAAAAAIASIGKPPKSAPPKRTSSSNGKLHSPQLGLAVEVAIEGHGM